MAPTPGRMLNADRKAGSRGIFANVTNAVLDRPSSAKQNPPDLLYLWTDPPVGGGDVPHVNRPGGADTEDVPVARGYRVLVVDDDLAIVATLRVILEIEGYVVETASNGAEALELIGAHPPALIMLDMRMPVM